MSTKTTSCSLEARKTQSCRLFIKTSFYTTSHFSSTNLCTQYHNKNINNLFKLSKLPMKLQVCVQKKIPPTIEQPSDEKSSMPPVSVASVFNQLRHLTRHPFDLSKTDCTNMIDWTNDAIWTYNFCHLRNKQIFGYDHKYIFNISTLSPMIDSI